MANKYLSYASFSQRLLAHNIDLMPLLALLYIGNLLIPKVSYDWLLYISLYLIYNVSFELSSMRGTPGKKWTRLSVVSEKGTLTLAQSVVRNTTKIFSLLLLFGGFIFILFNLRKKALHDYLGRTLVLFDED